MFPVHSVSMYMDPLRVYYLYVYTVCVFSLYVCIRSYGSRKEGSVNISAQLEALLQKRRWEGVLALISVLHHAT